jgi:transcriptional regulator with XRE-family HTH domain
MEEKIVAQRIRNIRTEKGLTLEEVARLTGFTKSLISKIENNKVSPPVSTLATIARALNVSLGDFFSPADAQSVKIVRRADRVDYKAGDLGSGHSIQSLVSGFRRQRMEPLIITIDDPDNYQLRLYSHPGQEFILVIEGSMGYRYDNQEFVLGEGDCLYFDAQNSHGPLPFKRQRVVYLSVLG